MQRLRLTASIFAGLLAFSIAGQAFEVPAKLSLNDAISLALKTHVNVKASETSQLASLSRLKIQRISTTLSFGTDTALQNSPGISQFSGQTFGSLTFESPSGTEASFGITPFGTGGNQGSVGLTLRHPLVRGRGMLSDKGYSLLSAESEVAVMNQELYQSRQSTILNVMEAYYNAVLEREQVKVQESALEIAKESAEGYRKREEAQLVTGLDVRRAELNVAQTQDDLNLQQQSARAAMDRLMLAIGAGVGQIPELTDAVPELKEQVSTLEEAIKLALQNRPELAIYEQRLANERRSLAIAKDQLRPDLDIVADLSSRNVDNGFLSSSIFNQGNSTVGMEYRIPLDKRIVQENRDIASRSLAILEEQRTYQEERIAEDVRQAYRNLEQAQISLGIYSENLDRAKEQLYFAQRLMEEGEGSSRDILDAQAGLTRVESGVLSAKTDIFLARMRLKNVVGEDLTNVRFE
jgi:outer membrane protein